MTKNTKQILIEILGYTIASILTVVILLGVMFLIYLFIGYIDWLFSDPLNLF